MFTVTAPFANPLLVLVWCLFVFATRDHWILETSHLFALCFPIPTDRRSGSHRTRGNKALTGGSFERNIEQGLTSSNFDLHKNIRDGDKRQGLENTQEIIGIMKKHGCNFDEARLIRQLEKMRANGIDPETGVPLDTKAFVFPPRQ